MLSQKAQKISSNFTLKNWASQINKSKRQKMNRLSTSYCNSTAQVNMKRITRYSLNAVTINN